MTKIRVHISGLPALITQNLEDAISNASDMLLLSPERAVRDREIDVLITAEQEHDKRAFADVMSKPNRGLIVLPADALHMTRYQLQLVSSEIREPSTDDILSTIRHMYQQSNQPLGNTGA
ncbi:MAG: hypothetical protein AAAFM81_00820 [Pseudomonadota bacterium]